MTIKVDFAGATHVGMVRANNEDTFVARLIDDEARVLCVVIDGMGGTEGGEVAAQIAAQTVFESLDTNRQGSSVARLKQALTLANNNICEQARSDARLHGMGCVATAAIIDPESKILSIVHIGDSRLYIYSDGKLTKLTHDHSTVGYREEVGLLTEEEAMHHPNRNLVERCLGYEMHQPDDANFLDAANYAIDTDCRLLLCSDGLCDMITSANMAEVLAMDLNPLETADTLIDRANGAGGRDNVTVVVATITTEGGEAVQPSAPEAAKAPETPEAVEAPEVADEQLTDEQLSMDFSPVTPAGRRQSLWRSPQALTVVAAAFLVGALIGLGGARYVIDRQDAEALNDIEVQHQAQLRQYRDSLQNLRDSLSVLLPPPTLTDSLTVAAD